MKRKTIQLHCDSKDGQKNNSSMNSNVTFQLNTPVTTNENEALSFTVDSFEIPIAFYLVNDTNNKIRYNYSGVENIVYIPNSNYTGQLLGETINALIPNINVTFDKYSFKLTFTSLHLFTLYNDSTAFDLMGFYTNTHKMALMLSGSFTLVSDKPVNLSGTKNLFIYTPDLSINTLTTKGNSGILLKAPIDCSFGEIYFYNNTSKIETPLNQNVITQIQIKIKDDVGNYVNLQGFDFSFSLSFYITENNVETMTANTDLMGVHTNK